MFVNLHTHSHFSCLDGLGKIPDIVSEAKRQGATSVGITDHASISCLPSFLKEAKKQEINPVVGCEFYIAETAQGIPKEKRYHLTVWAKNWAGVQSIMKQLTLANKQFYHRPRLTFEQALNFENCFIGTACCFGVLAHTNYKAFYVELLGAYGEDIFLEIMPHSVILADKGGIDLQAMVNGRAADLKAEHGGRLLLTNDAHYVKAEDQQTHRLLLATQYHKKIEDFAGWGDGFHMRDTTEMIVAADKVGIPREHILEGIENTVFVSNAVAIEMPEFKINLPSIYPDDNDAFSRIIMDGWQSKIDGTLVDFSAYMDRMIYEIGVVKNMGFIKYFLIVHDMIAWARGKGIICGPARGSSAGSLICYLMDIVQVDPIKHGLYFERFLNPSRVEMPDIDVDFQDDRRQEVFEYMTEKYGKDKTAFINTFSSLSVKSAFRDVSRAHSIDNFTVNNLSKQIEGVDSFSTESELISFATDNPGVVESAKKLDGVIRQVGVNACGFCISEKPLEEVCVLERRKNANKGEIFVTSWDKRESENFGLLKVDILGLSTLSILGHARKSIMAKTGKYIKFTDIPLDDPATIELFRNGETTGIFQFESSGMRSLLKNMNLRDFKEITHATALYRPGSLQSGQTERYVNICKGEAMEDYPAEVLRDILTDTKSVLVYQEQVIRIFHEMGGFTLSEADIMRKIIGKKLGPDEFEKHRDHFVQGCLVNCVNEVVSNELFTAMVEFSGYGFNLSHATSYTMISMWCAYLKTHFPTEFMAAVMTCSSDDGLVSIMEEAKRLKIPILQPDINTSGNTYLIDFDGNIRYPLSAIKGVGVKATETILTAREDGHFVDMENFMTRINKRACNKRVVQVLCDAGAFEGLGIVEEDKEKRAKAFATLIAGYADTPEITFTADYDIQSIVNFSDKYTNCANMVGHKAMLPHVLESYSGLMVINGLTKRQRTVKGGRHTDYLVGLLKSVGVKESSVYFTSPLKCQTSAKDCKIKCLESLKEEIKIVKPKLILCLSVDAVSIFEKAGKMAKLAGKIQYNAEFDTHVLFAYSPQYALYKEGDIKERFEQNIRKIKNIIDLGETV